MFSVLDLFVDLKTVNLKAVLLFKKKKKKTRNSATFLDPLTNAYKILKFFSLLTASNFFPFKKTLHFVQKHFKENFLEEFFSFYLSTISEGGK